MIYQETDNVLTVDGLSTYLKIPKSTIYKLTREGKIPSHKVGRHLRFHREAIDDWLKGKGKENEQEKQGCCNAGSE